MATKIEWATETWNPVVGCTKLSAGCKNCYALQMARRLRGAGHRGYEDVIGPHGEWSGRIGIRPLHVWDEPYRWRKPRAVFVCSMGDLFHDGVPTWVHDRVFSTMSDLPQHRFMLLTKRPLRMVEVFGNRRVPGNVLVGVTVEDRAAVERISHLLKVNCAVRFVSVEPMLEDVSDAIDVRQLDWVICGAETGNRKRPMSLQWAEKLFVNCGLFDVPFFGKKDSNGDPLCVYGCVVRQVNVGFGGGGADSEGH